MEILELLFLVADGLLELLLTLSAGTDAVAWQKSRKNRSERRKAKKQGKSPPARETWTWVFQALMPVVLILAAFALWKWLDSR